MRGDDAVGFGNFGELLLRPGGWVVNVRSKGETVAEEARNPDSKRSRFVNWLTYTILKFTNKFIFNLSIWKNKIFYFIFIEP